MYILHYYIYILLFDTNMIVIYDNAILNPKNVFLSVYFQKVWILTQTV